jgi:hypothetical protein
MCALPDYVHWFAKSPTNISMECHIRYQFVICLSVMWQADGRKVSSSVLNTDDQNLNYVCQP